MMGLTFNIIYSVCWSLTSPSTLYYHHHYHNHRHHYRHHHYHHHQAWFVLFCQRLEERQEHRRSQSNSTYMSFQAQSLTHNLSILAASVSAKVMKIICGVCASIIIMVIGLILVRKRKLWIKRYHRRSSKFVL